MSNLKRLKIFNFAKFQAVLATLLGLLAGTIYSFGGLIFDLFTIGPNFGTVLAFLALIGMPILFGVVGFALGLLEATLFNFSSRWIGGVEIDF